jgi:Na+-translocating ferredoxin:NAD+ oxidoreductase subunit C
MRPSRTFRQGGIRVEAGLDRDQRDSVKNAFLPNAAVVLLKQHAGKQARCVVKRGEYVSEGMVIGKADGSLSANVHSPVPGIVRDIRIVQLPEGGKAQAVVVALEGSFDRLGRKDEPREWKGMGRNEILSSLRSRGVVDTEAPGLPLFDLLGDRRDIGLLAVNSVECEPYLRAEACLLNDKGAVIMEGIDILRKLLSPRRTVIAITNADAPGPFLSSSSSASGEGAEVECLRLAGKYPQDMPRQLLEAVDGSRRRPLDEAVVIVRPSTVYAVYEAIALGKPMVERYVAVGGAAIKRPAVLKARIGTPVGDLIEECGGFLGPPARLVLGGTLRGHSVRDLDAPITKTTSAVIALNAEEVGSRLKSSCIRCGRCADVCPERLDPDLLFRLVERGMLSRANELGLGACTSCGACGYVCPSRLPLVAAFSAEAQYAAKASEAEEIGR